jgi:hypothetical protein
MLIVGLICQAALGALLLFGGARYATRREFMPYHRVAAGRDWSSYDAGTQAVILALLRIAGSAMLGFGVINLALAYDTIHDRGIWPKLVVLAGNLILTSALLAAARAEARHNEAPAPVLPALALMALAVAAFILTTP